MCRSWRELSNAYFLAKFGFDTADNEAIQFCGGDIFFLLIFSFGSLPDLQRVCTGVDARPWGDVVQPAPIQRRLHTDGIVQRGKFDESLNLVRSREDHATIHAARSGVRRDDLPMCILTQSI